jgi:protease-4
MSNSTKWFLIIAGLLFFFGLLGLGFISLLVVGMTDREVDVTTGSGQKIAVVELQGEITSSDEIVRQFRKYRENHSIKAVLFRVDSPGGGVVASQEIYEEVRKTRASGKPVIVSMGSLAASGGYYVSCGANRIVANPGTLTGSIGVISQFMNFDTLMDGVHRQFIAAVEHERKIDHDSVVSYADGRVFTGEQAYAMKLIDTLGTYEDAIKIAARIAGISDDPAIVKERKRGLTLFERLFGEVMAGNLDGLREELFHRPILQYRMMQGL